MKRAVRARLFAEMEMKRGTNLPRHQALRPSRYEIGEDLFLFPSKASARRLANWQWRAAFGPQDGNVVMIIVRGPTLLTALHTLLVEKSSVNLVVFQCVFDKVVEQQDQVSTDARVLER